jgi:hypothetical protein
MQSSQPHLAIVRLLWLFTVTMSTAVRKSHLFPYLCSALGRIALQPSFGLYFKHICIDALATSCPSGW